MVAAMRDSGGRDVDVNVDTNATSSRSVVASSISSIMSGTTLFTCSTQYLLGLFFV